MPSTGFQPLFRRRLHRISAGFSIVFTFAFSATFSPAFRRELADPAVEKWAVDRRWTRPGENTPPHAREPWNVRPSTARTLHSTRAVGPGTFGFRACTRRRSRLWAPSS